MLKYDSNLNFSLDTALTLIAQRITPNSRVLEFGPATGYMTKHFKQVLNCKVVAVELDPDSARLTAPFCEKMIIGDIDKYPWAEELNGFEFDHIIFSDVLEHVYDPWSALKKAASLLAKDGTILTSIPNVSHSSIVMNLLNGIFDYHSLGLMDKTHIRFFTRKSVLDLLQQANLAPIEWLTTRCSPENSEFKNYYQNFSAPVQNALKNRLDSEVYQFIAVSKKSEKNLTFIDSISTPTLSFDLARFSVWFLDSEYKPVADPTDALLTGENAWTKYNIAQQEGFSFSHLGMTPTDQPAICSLRNIKLHFIDGSSFVLPWNRVRLKKSLALPSKSPDSIEFFSFGKTTIEYEADPSLNGNIKSIEFEMKINRNLSDLLNSLNDSLDRLGALENVPLYDVLKEASENQASLAELKNEIVRIQNSTFLKRVKRKLKTILNL